MPVFHEQFAALGTTVEGGLQLRTPTAAAELWSMVRKRTAQFEQQFSRFRPDSELSRLNTRAGQSVRVSQHMLDLLSAATVAWERSDHLVSPLVGRAMLQAGYDRSFDRLQMEQVAAGRSAERERRPVETLQAVRIDRDHQTVELPTGTSIDFGGIGKGYLLDQLVELVSAQTTDFWLSLGGDLVVSGTNDGQSWEIGVQDPTALDRDWATLALPSGKWGVATSSIMKRRGIHHGRPWHHIIDPRTGQPAQTDVLAATVVTHDGLSADVFAKAIVVRGAADGLAWASKLPDVQALVITEQGKMFTTPHLKPLLTVL